MVKSNLFVDWWCDDTAIIVKMIVFNSQLYLPTLPVLLDLKIGCIFMFILINCFIYALLNSELLLNWKVACCPVIRPDILFKSLLVKGLFLGLIVIMFASTHIDRMTKVMYKHSWKIFNLVAHIAKLSAKSNVFIPDL